MSETKTPDAPVQPVSTKTPDAPISPVSTKTLKAKRAKARAPAVSKPVTPIKAKAPITRHIPAGTRIDPDATTVTCNVDIRDVKTQGNKNWIRAAAGYPKAGESKLLAACIKDGVTKGDVLYDWCRGWLELDPPPAAPAKKK
jgi:hypothetical protein